jgi:flagellar hook-associated protein 2
MSSNAKTAPRDTFRFEVEVDDKKHEITFTSNDNLTNQQFLQQMAHAINTANVGLVASVSGSADGSNSTLNIESLTTGARNDGNPRFTISDISGNAVSVTGVTNVVREGQDALFSVNGGQQQSSKSNEVNLGNGLEITLVGAFEEAVPVVRGRDSFGTQNLVRQMVNQFNALLDTARGNAADLRTARLARDLEIVVRRNARDMRELGVSMNASGLMTIDESRLRAASESGAVANFFSGENGRNEFVSSLDRITESIISNPVRHISRHTARAPGFNSALNALANSGAGSTPATRFDAYFQNDPLGSLLNIMR